jgi:hypothetical protein
LAALVGASRDGCSAIAAIGIARHAVMKPAARIAVLKAERREEIVSSFM